MSQMEIRKLLNVSKALTSKWAIYEKIYDQKKGSDFEIFQRKRIYF